MHRRTKFRLVILASFLIIGLIFVSCSDDDDDNGTGPTTDDGFMADIADFQDFANWEVIDYTVYPTNSSLLTGAHNGNNPDAARMVYKNPNAGVTSGEYDRESIILKETFTWSDGQKMPVDAGAFLAMVKRGGDYNSDGSGWEFLSLGADGSSIAARGYTAEDIGGCQSCHSAAIGDVGMDYVFDSPSEYAVPDGGEFDLFDNPTSWQKVDSLFGPDPLLD